MGNYKKTLYPNFTFGDKYLIAPKDFTTYRYQQSVIIGFANKVYHMKKISAPTV